MASFIKERDILTPDTMSAGDGIAGLAGTPDRSSVPAVMATSVAMTLALDGIGARITCQLVQHRSRRRDGGATTSFCRTESGHIRVLTRNGHDWSDRYPSIVAAASALKCKSAVIDGEAIVQDSDGISDFECTRAPRRPQHWPRHHESPWGDPRDPCRRVPKGAQG
jgi:hypothetical protein